MLKIDFHTHTCCSPDAVHGIRPMIRQAKRVGLDGIAITDHNRLLDQKTANQLSKEFDILVLPGVEGGKIASGKHWLGIGISSIPQEFSINNIVSRINDDGGIAIAPHPWTGRGFRSFEKHGFNAVETLNGTTPFSNSLIKNSGHIPEVGGSDAHTACMLGYSWTEVDASHSVDDILQAVIRGLCRPAGGIVPWWCHPMYWGQLGLRYFRHGITLTRNSSGYPAHVPLNTPDSEGLV